MPSDDPTLTFATLYDTEIFWDYAFVQVSTDGGKTYKSLANEHTTSEIDPQRFRSPWTTCRASRAVGRRRRRRVGDRVVRPDSLRR